MHSKIISLILTEFILSIATFQILALQSGSAQSSTAETSNLLTDFQAEASQESVWEFGMQLSSRGDVRGVTGTIPIPRNWPEQEVVLEFEQKSENVRELKYSDPTKTSRQLEFKIKRLATDDSAEALVRFRIKKFAIQAPTKTNQLVIPDPIPASVVNFLQPSPSIESNHQQIRNLALELKDDSLSAWAQTEKIYRWVRQEINYKFDLQIRSCLYALERKQGDCEELTSLFIAICCAHGIPARAVWIPGHAYAEFYLEDEQGRGYWFPCQAAGPYEFGSMNEARPILQKGDRVRLPGTRELVRYLQPTVQAKIATKPIQIQWISREVSAGKKIRRRPP